jgi:hypothetical protein
MTSRLIEFPWELQSDNALGIKTVSDQANPNYGRIRLPPIMDTQLDQIIIQKFLQPLREKLLLKLKNQMDGCQPGTWWETYLSLFILLHHTAMSSRHGRRFAVSYGLKVSFAQSMA